MKRVLVVLSGGAMKGLAHVGAMRVLRRLDLPVVAYAGTSVGSIVAALAACGLTVAEIENIGMRVGRKTILDFDWRGMLVRQFRTPGINRGDALLKFVSEVIPTHNFAELATPLYVNAVDLVTGANVVFGLPGLADVPVPEAVAASCSIPGIYAPRKIGNGYFADGSVVDNLQLRLASLLDIDFIVAVNLRGFNVMTNGEIEKLGFLEILNRGNDLTGQFVTEVNLAQHRRVPMVIVHPDVAKFDSFTFDNSAELIAEGERATEAAFARFHRAQGDSVLDWLFRGNQSPVVGNPFVIDESRCTRCALCVINNMDGLFSTRGPGQPVTVNRLKRSTHDIAPVKECPFGAIKVDADLLRQMYGDDPPEILEKLARDGGENLIGRPPFAPLPVDVASTDAGADATTADGEPSGATKTEPETGPADGAAEGATIGDSPREKSRKANASTTISGRIATALFRQAAKPPPAHAPTDPASNAAPHDPDESTDQRSD